MRVSVLVQQAVVIRSRPDSGVSLDKLRPTQGRPIVAEHTGNESDQRVLICTQPLYWVAKEHDLQLNLADISGRSASNNHRTFFCSISAFRRTSVRWRNVCTSSRLDDIRVILETPGLSLLTD